MTTLEKFHAKMGEAMATNLKFYGNDYAACYKEQKYNDPLPGETLYADPNDDPEIKKINNYVQFMDKSTNR